MRALASLLLVASSVAAQPVVVGTVLDAETGEPLPGANVIASGTTRGTSTDRSGQFVLEVGAGTARIAASMLGYQATSTTLRFGAADSLRVAFRLVPSVEALGAVEVIAQDDGWVRALQTFTLVFLGATPNADRAALVNPEIIDLEAERGSLDARAVAPLHVRNDALGYDVTVYDLALVADRNGRAWDGFVRFEDACDGSCSESVLEAREQTYRGSIDHFFRSAVAGRPFEEGFTTRPAARTGSGPSLNWYVRKIIGMSVDTTGYVLEAAPHGWDMVVERSLLVEYRDEPDGRPLERGDSQRSWLAPVSGRIPLGPDGTLIDGAAVVRHGYWDWERFADLLPTDYRPPE